MSAADQSHRSAHFCSLPWTGIDVSAQGLIKPCCKFAEPVAVDFASYACSPVLQQTQREFLQGGKPAGCQRCWNDEAAGLPSKRQLDHEYVLSPAAALDQVQILALTFGNACNLACVTCNGSSSSGWLRDEMRLADQFSHVKIRRHNKHYRDQAFIDEILSRCTHLRHLEISGGEPFVSDRELHLDLLHRIPNPDHVKIHYVTNGTLFPDADFWQVWQRFRHIDIQISIDGIEQRFEYLRYPAQWSSVQANIARYQEQSQVQLSISHTVSWINLLMVDKFVTWCTDNQLPRPYIGPVSRPDFLNVKALPSWAKARVREQFKSCQHEETGRIIDYMMDADLSHCFDEGKKWLAALDHLRGLRHLETFPELRLLTQH